MKGDSQEREGTVRLWPGSGRAGGSREGLASVRRDGHFLVRWQTRAMACRF